MSLSLRSRMFDHIFSLIEYLFPEFFFAFFWEIELFCNLYSKFVCQFFCQNRIVLMDFTHSLTGFSENGITSPFLICSKEKPFVIPKLNFNYFDFFTKKMWCKHHSCINTVTFVIAVVWHTSKVDRKTGAISTNNTFIVVYYFNFDD